MILVIDDAPIYRIDIVKDKIKNAKQISIILVKFIDIFNLYISINKLSKDESKKRNTQYCIDQKDTR